MMTMIRLVALVFSLFFASYVMAAPVNVNSASASEIADALSGVGEVKAQAIVEYRKAHGGFKSVDELANVKGIGAKTLEKNKGDILLSDKK
jgi:DNA uptake protein and related DNA-binding proteins